LYTTHYDLILFIVVLVIFTSEPSWMWYSHIYTPPAVSLDAAGSLHHGPYIFSTTLIWDWGYRVGSDVIYLLAFDVIWIGKMLLEERPFLWAVRVE